MNIVFRPHFAPRGTFAPKTFLFAPKKSNAPPPPRRGENGIAKKEGRGMFATIKRDIREGTALLGGLGLGAGLMYLLDPDRGRRRRATARDQVVELLHEAVDTLDKGLRDLNNRVSGRLVRAVSAVIPDPVSDDVLAERVRSCLGHSVSYPQAITVSVADGQVDLSGHVLRNDVPRLMTGLRRIRGVKGIVDQLTLHEQAGEVPDMHGKPHRIADQALLAPRWSPAARLGTAAAGGLLAFYGLRRRSLTGLGMAAAGLGVMARSLQKPPSRSFATGDHMGRGVDLQKTITVDAPPERVFRMLAGFENLPLFMSHIQEVKKLEDGAYRWTVTGPGGAKGHWDAEIVKSVENEVLEWKTRPGTMVEHAGVVRLDPTPYGGTRVHIRLSYRPPFGRVGIGLADLFNLYPKHMLDKDLACFKSLLEQGKTTAHHHKVRLSELHAG
jgi:uncharacterized membrane protein